MTITNPQMDQFNLPAVLDYTQPLIVKDRLISASDLVKRLKSLNNQLRSFLQDAIDLKSCANAALHLVHPSLIKHRDRAVQILVATCIAELLRLYAPSPPYSQENLQDIFALMASQCARLNQIDNPYHGYHLQLLDSIVLVRSIGLISDLDTVEDLILAFFTHILASVSDQLPPNVHRHAADLLIAIIEECPVIPLDAVMLLFEPLMPAQTINDASFSDAINISDNQQSATYKLVCNVIREAGQLLSKQAAEYLLTTSLLAAKHIHSRSNESIKLSNDNKIAHYLMTIIYPLNAQMIVNVIPQLEEELITDHPPTRDLALRTLASMFKFPATLAPSLVRDAAPVWKVWCSRSSDKHVPVRLAWLECMSDIYNVHGHHDGVATDMNTALLRLLLDPDNKVRVAACTLFSSSKLHFDTLRKAASTEVWEALGARIKDKRSSVRLAAIQATGVLWRHVMHVVLPAKYAPEDSISAKQTTTLPLDVLSQAPPQSQQGLPASAFQLAHTNLEPSELTLLLTTFAWCPHDLLNSAYLNDSELTAMFENLLIETVIHPKDITTSSSGSEMDFTLVTDRLLWFLSPVVDNDNDKIRRAFGAIISRQRVTITEMNALIDSAEQYVSANVQLTPLLATQSMSSQEHLVQLIAGMAARLPNNHQSQQVLNMFVKAYNPTWGLGLKSLGDWHEHGVAAMRKQVKLVVRTIENAIPGSIHTIGVIARRMTPLIVYHEMVMPLVDRILRRTNQDNSVLSQFILEAGWEPRLRTAAHWVLDALAHDAPLVVSRYADEIVTLLGSALDRSLLLRILSVVPCPNLSSANVSMLVQWVKTSTDNVESIACILARGKYAPECAELVQYCTRILVLDTSNTTQVAAVLEILNKVAKYQVRIYQESDAKNGLTTKAMQFLFKEYPEAELIDQPFTQTQLPSNTKLQVAAIKLVTNRCIALSENASTDIREVVTPLMALLDRVLSTKGSLDKSSVPEYAASALRIATGRAVLKIARTRAITDLIPEPIYLRMALLITDPDDAVRNVILTKVRCLLANTKVTARWVPVLALAANDPSNRSSTLSLLRGMASNPLCSRGVAYALSRLVHVLAHIVPFGKLGGETIKKHAAPIDLFLDAVMRADNVSILFNQLVQIKEYRSKEPVFIHAGEMSDVDQFSQHINTHLYILSEYGTKQLRDKGKFHGWPIATVTETVALPSDIFVALNSSASIANAKVAYLDHSINAGNRTSRRLPTRKLKEMDSLPIKESSKGRPKESPKKRPKITPHVTPRNTALPRRRAVRSNSYVNSDESNEGSD